MPRINVYLALLLAAAFWGFGNIAQKTVLQHIGPFNAVCLRCAIAAVVVLPFVGGELGQLAKPGWWRSALGVAILFAAALTMQQVAYLSASVTNASFLVNTATVITPFVAWLAFRELPGRLGGAAAILTLAGIFLMSGSDASLTSLGKGDLACLLSGLLYAIWMVLLNRHMKRYDTPFITAFFQFFVAACVALPMTVWLEETTMAAIRAAVPELAVLGVFSTAGAFGLQTYAQRFTTASRAAVIVSAESLFGAMGAYWVLGERPSPSAFIGGGLIFTAIVAIACSIRSVPVEIEDDHVKI